MKKMILKTLAVCLGACLLFTGCSSSGSEQAATQEETEVSSTAARNVASGFIFIKKLICISDGLSIFSSCVSSSAESVLTESLLLW